jgi:hypothetical protein
MMKARSLLLLCAAVVPSAVIAQPVASTRLISCGAESCLLIRGHRASPQATVRINGRPIEADGGRTWRVTLPLATVRDWSAPFARTVEVAIGEPTGASVEGEAVRLPVGLLARGVELASLTVRAR